MLQSPTKHGLMAPLSAGARRLFEPGEPTVTPEALRAIRGSSEDALRFLNRHATGDWGMVSETHAEANRRALTQGGTVLSVFALEGRGYLYVTTELPAHRTMVSYQPLG